MIDFQTRLGRSNEGFATLGLYSLRQLVGWLLHSGVPLEFIQASLEGAFKDHSNLVAKLNDEA